VRLRRICLLPHNHDQVIQLERLQPKEAIIEEIGLAQKACSNRAADA
jgi:hypothetical protein